MGLIGDEIKELRQMLKLYKNGKLTEIQVRTQISIFKESAKRTRWALDALIANNKPHRVGNTLHSLNILSRGEHIQSSAEIELEMIMCPDQDKAVTREACLDFSGSSNNTKNCQSCENFGITRKMLGRK